MRVVTLLFLCDFLVLFRLEQPGEKAAARCVFENVFVQNCKQSHERYRDEDPGNAGDLFTRKHRQNNRQRMQVNSLSNYSWVDEVILSQSESGKEQRCPQRLP